MDPTPSPTYRHIANAIALEGLAVTPGFISPARVAELAAECRRRDAEAAFSAARIGKHQGRRERADIRGDRISWIDDGEPRPAEVPLQRELEALRVELNRSLFLGLFDLEMHYAIYPSGAGYKRHRDRFAGDASDARILSCVLYLNESWSDGDGGMLRIHREESVLDVLPTGGTLVCFLADRFEHEVLPARRERLSLTGWFRGRR